MNIFQLKIFQEINKGNIGKNITLCPISIYHILSLTTNGAAKKTLEEMLKTLCNNDLNKMNQNNKLIASILEKFQSIELANAVFTKFNPEQSFIQIIKQYRAKIDVLKDAAQVNKWCSEATHKKIQRIIDKITDNDLMVLINAIYFKGIWQKTFDPQNTIKNNFMCFNKDPRETLFMNIKDNFNYFENDEVQSISLNYKEDNMKALILLPKIEKDINNYIKNLTLENYYYIIKNLFNQRVALSLPKFEINFGAELKQNFISLGMVQAFTNEADFSPMIKKNNVKIGRIIHKTYIKVDEKGTEAAAVTAVIMVEKCCAPQKEVIMNVNSPFLFIIRNDSLPPGHDIIFVSKVETLGKAKMVKKFEKISKESAKCKVEFKKANAK